MLIEHLAISYDPRWPAILLREHLELYQIGKDDMYSEVVYFSGLWNLLGPRILDRRHNPMIHKVKMIVQVGTGIGLEPDEVACLQTEVSLVDRMGFRPAKEMARHDFEVSQFLTPPPTWPNQPPVIFKRVLGMVQAYQSKIPPAPIYRSDFENHDYKRPIATPARVVLGDLGILLPWINHHGDLTINDLATKINLNKPQLQDHLSRHFLTAWIDIGMYPEYLPKARAKPPGPNEPVEIPESPTSAEAEHPEDASTALVSQVQVATGPRGAGAETRSPAQRALGESSTSTASPLQPQAPITLAPMTWQQVIAATPPHPGKAVPTSESSSKTTSANTETTKKKIADGRELICRATNIGRVGVIVFGEQ